MRLFNVIMKNFENRPLPIRPLDMSGFDGFQAAPLLLTGDDADPRLVQQQNELADNFVIAARTELAGTVKPPIIDFVASSIVNRMKAREGLNSGSYNRRRYKKVNYAAVPEYPRNVVYDAAQHALIGTGTVLENSISHRALGMESGELANVTVIDTFRAELEPAMWQAVSELIGHDVAPSDDEEYEKIAILGYDRDISKSDHIGAIRVGMPRYLGLSAGDVRVKARTFAVLDTSPSSGFNQETVDRLIFAEKKGKPLSDKAITWLLVHELSKSRILAKNHTIYDVES